MDLQIHNATQNQMVRCMYGGSVVATKYSRLLENPSCDNMLGNASSALDPAMVLVSSKHSISAPGWVTAHLECIQHARVRQAGSSRGLTLQRTHQRVVVFPHARQHRAYVRGVASEHALQVALQHTRPKIGVVCRQTCARHRSCSARLACDQLML